MPKNFKLSVIIFHTVCDLTTVKKKADFLNVTNAEELRTMLLQEVKLKNSKELKKSIGF